MPSSSRVRSHGEWQDRMKGRAKFNAAEAEATIRAAYRASGLVEPNHVLLANGPTEAAWLVRFAQAPPQSQRRFALGLTALGAAVFVSMSVIALDKDLLAGQPASETTFWCVMSGLVLLAISQRVVPLPSKTSRGRPGGRSIIGGAVIGMAMALYAVLLQHLGHHTYTAFERTGIVLLGALIGGLPGRLLRRRLDFVYRNLPAPLVDLEASASVAAPMNSAWAATTSGASSAALTAYRRSLDESHFRVRDHAQTEGFVRRDQREGSDVGIIGDPPFAMDLLTAGWPPSAALPGHIRRARPVPRIPGFVDSFAQAARIASRGGNTAASPSAFVDLAFCLDTVYPFRKAAIGVRPATLIATDMEGRVHDDIGPAVRWADGTELYAWHGYPLPRAIMDRDVPITPARIEQTTDPVARRALVDRYGLGRYLRDVGAHEFQSDQCGRLYRLHQPFDEPIVAVRVRNATPEADGHIQEFWLRVPPDTRTAREGVAWSFGLRPWEYQPRVES